MTKILLKLGLVAAGGILLILGQIIFQNTYKFPQMTYGVSFSPSFARSLNLDWKDTYIKILDDLKVRKIRIPTYWDEIEPKDNKLDFSQVDFMLDKAQKREAKIILVLGARQPRWPECQIPNWARSLSLKDRQLRVLELIQKVVERYKQKESIEYWQVENEPLLGVFGKGCDAPDEKFLAKEVALVRSLDKRPIIVSDSGELGFWITPMKLSDVFGTTLYRRVYNSFLGYTTYPILPYFYNIKSSIVRSLFASNNQKTIIVELQAEPWASLNNLNKIKIESQIKTLSLNDFKNYIDYAKKTGFDTSYLWGVEWWYWMSQNGHPEYLEYAKSLFK